MAKRLACFFGQITQDYQEEATFAIRNAAEELGYTLDIFTEFGSYGENFLHAEGEKNIINLPYLEDYDGILVGLDTFDNTGMDDELVARLQRENVGPVISVRQVTEEFTNVMIDDRLAMADMIEHYVTVHHFKRICFMTGRMEMEDAQKRLQGYYDVMEKYNLPIDDHMIFYGDYWRYKGDEAVEFFLDDEEMPQAIACANDYMALAVCDALKKRGYKIPEDIAVSGFDDVDEARYADPKIASVRVPAEKMGREAVYKLDAMIRGEQVEKDIQIPVKGNYRGTCGCGRPERGKTISELYSKKEYLRHALMQNAYMNVDYENSNTVAELLSTAFVYSFNFAYDCLYICLCENFSEFDEGGSSREQYTDDIVLRAMMSRDLGFEEMDVHFKRREILPERYRSLSETLYVMPLHYKNHCMGYIAIQTEKPQGLKEFYQAWLLGLSSFLDKVSMYEQNQNLLEFRKLSVVDDLTGLYNRRMMEKELITRVPEVRPSNSFHLISLDMDGLKYINDTLGHAEGDQALCAFAGILKKNMAHGMLCARMGGDEFEIYVNNEDEGVVRQLIETIQTDIESYNAAKVKPYVLSASVGYAKYQMGEELSKCIQRADSNMYQDKARKKNIYKERGKKG